MHRFAPAGCAREPCMLPSMKPGTLVWLMVCGGLIAALSATDIPGWAAGAVVIAALALAIPSGVKRYRLERSLARTARQALPRLRSSVNPPRASTFAATQLPADKPARQTRERNPRTS